MRCRSLGSITLLETWLSAKLASSMSNLRFMAGVVVAAIAVSSIATAIAVSSQAIDAPLLATGKWKRIFSEEFDANSLNGKLWTTCYWWNDNGCTNLGNEELQWYTPNNVSVLDGYLRLTARPENIKGFKGQAFTFTSGMVTTGFDEDEIPSEPRFAFQYGRIDVRAKLPAGKGLWPALWMLPGDHKSRPEIDIMETYGDSPSLLRMHVHYDDIDGHEKSVGETAKTVDLTEGWHVFGLEWEPNAIAWYLDGIQVWRYTDVANIPREQMYLLMNLAVGSSGPGKPDRTTNFPAEFLIDYVRVWQRVP
jgi:beta-glucanase (GH16 family)